MNTKDFIRLGIPLGEATRRATDFVCKFILSGGDKTRLEEEVKAIMANPALFAEDPLRKELAKAIVNAPPPPRSRAGQIPPVGRRTGARGGDADGESLPAAGGSGRRPHAGRARGLRPADWRSAGYREHRHSVCGWRGYRLPHEDDGARYPGPRTGTAPGRLTRAIEAETRFGVGASFKNRRQHEVLDADWDVSPVTKQNKDRAWSQLGTSGSGNHFVEFGLFTAHGEIHGLGTGNLRGIAVAQRQPRHGCGGM